MAEQHSTLGRRVTKSRACHERNLKVRKGNISRMIKDPDHSHFDRTIYDTVPWINIQGQAHWWAGEERERWKLRRKPSWGGWPGLKGAQRVQPGQQHQRGLRHHYSPVIEATALPGYHPNS